MKQYVLIVYRIYSIAQVRINYILSFYTNNVVDHLVGIPMLP